MKEAVAKQILEKIRRDYSEIADDFHQTRKSDWKEFHIFLNYIKDGNFIADLGCGNGRFYDFIKKYNKISYIGIDNNKKLLKHAETQQKAKFIHGDLLSLPLDNEIADLAVAIASLHHIPSQKFRKQAVKEIYRILKKDGFAIVTTWNLFQPKYKKYIWKARLKHISSLGKYDWRDCFIPWGKSEVIRYYYAFTAKELRKLLQNAGFKIVLEHIGRNISYICKKS